MKILVLGFASPDPLEIAVESAGNASPETKVVAKTTPEAAVVALLDHVDLEWLNTLKLTVIGRVQHRRRRAERPPQYQDHPN